MKSQTVIISSYLAAVLVVIIMVAMYVSLFPWMTSYNINYRRTNVLVIIREKTHWGAKELALNISSRLGADYVYVDIKAINIIDNTVVYEDRYNISLVDVPLKELTIFIYSYSRTTRNGTMYIYYVEVGYR